MAVLEWRLYFSKNRLTNVMRTQMSDEAMKDIIEGRIIHLKEQFNTLIAEFHIADETLDYGSACPIKAIKTYDFEKEPN